jgi:hypothetical protein
VADLAPVEAAHCAPGDALHAQQQHFGMDAAVSDFPIFQLKTRHAPKFVGIVRHKDKFTC